MVLWLCLFSNPASLFALDPSRSISQHMAMQYQKDNGLPCNAAQAIAQTPDGYLWIGTPEGLSQFNSVKFRNHDLSNTPEMRNQNIRCLCVRRDGSLWIGTSEGLVRYHQGNFTADARIVGLTNRSILSLHEDRAGTLWIGTGQSLCQLSGGVLTQFSTNDGWRTIGTHAICEDAQNRIWLGTSDGLYCYQNRQFTRFTTTNGLAHNYVFSLRLDPRDQSLWIGTERGLSQFQRGKFTTYTTEHGLDNSRVNTLLFDSKFNLWVGTSYGFNRWLPTKQRFENSRDLLAYESVQAMFEDREGNLWLGTEFGLFRLSDSRFKVYGQAEGLKSALLFTVYQDRQDTLWMGAWLGGLNRFKNGTFTNFTVPHGLSQSIVTGLFEDHAGTLWIGTRRGGLNRYDQGVFTNYTMRGGLSDDQVLCFYEETPGVLWIGTGAGLTIRSNGVFTKVRLPLGHAKPTIRFIGPTSDGSLWLGTDRALLQRTPAREWRYHSRANGLTNDSIYHVFESRDGTIWTGTGNGLAGYKNGQWFTIQRAQGLLARDVIWMTEDSLQNLWFSSSSGIYRLARQELDAFRTGRRAHVSPITFSKDDGLRVSECRWLGSPAGWRGQDGRLWFATKRGLAVVEPEKIQPINPPPVIIEQVVVDGKLREPRTISRLDPNSRHIEFHYEALNFLAPEKKLFRYRLHGFDNQYIEAGRRTIASYGNLPPGRYRFHVIARNNDGAWNEEGASLEFYLPPRFYQTEWFVVLCVVSVVSLTVVAYRARVSQLQRREQELLSEVDERTRKLQAEVTERLNLEQQLRQAQKMEAVGQLAAGVAHDFNNILTVIRGHANLLLSEPRENPNDAESLAQIDASAQRAADLTRQLLTFSRKQLMQPRVLDLNELLTNLAKLLHRLLGETIQFELNLASALPALRADATMIEQIVMNLSVNARDAMPKGGRLQLSTECRQITPADVRLNPEARVGEFICLRVTDTGCGMDAATLSHIFEPFFTTKAVGKGTGLGLATVYGIVKQHAGWIQVQSEVGRGTTFAVFLPAVKETIGRSPNAEAAPKPRGGRETVLVVEDEPALRTLVSGILVHHGYRVLTAVSGVDALKVWQEHKHDIALLLTDMIMPEGMTGKELAERLERDKPDLRVILTTGYSLDLVNSGPDIRNGYPCLQKPYPPNKLVSLIRECLDRPVCANN